MEMDTERFASHEELKDIAEKLQDAVFLYKANTPDSFEYYNTIVEVVNFIVSFMLNEEKRKVPIPYEMELALEDQHQMFIQAFMWKKICSADEVRSLHKKCHERNGVAVNVNDLKNFVEKINSAIRPMNMAIVKGIDEITGEQYYVLINDATDNAIAKLSSEYKTNEIELFKKIINSIIESDDGKVTSTTILNLSDEVHISKKEADEIITKFHEDGWLIEDEGYIYFSTRAIVELQHFFKVHFEDEVVMCNICRNIVFQGETCKNKKCGGKFHKHCKAKYSSNMGENVCPNCRTLWK